MGIEVPEAPSVLAELLIADSASATEDSPLAILLHGHGHLRVDAQAGEEVREAVQQRGLLRQRHVTIRNDAGLRRWVGQCLVGVCHDCIADALRNITRLCARPQAGTALPEMTESSSLT